MEPSVAVFTLALAEPLHTARLRVRRWESAEQDAFAAIYADPGVHRYLYSEPATPDEVPELFGRRLRDPATDTEGGAVRLAVEVTATGEVVGETVLILRSVTHLRGELGYVLAPGAEGNGYATEAARAVIGWGFAAGLHRIVAHADARNTASIAVMERLGMRREAFLVRNERVKGEWTDEVVHALLAQEWPPV